MKKYIRLMRCKHYIKNAVIFLPFLFGREFTGTDKLTSAVAGFAVFCFLSSAVYVLNDIRDKEADARHPEKKKRPLASGAVTEGRAWILFLVCLAAAALIQVFFCGMHGVLIPAVYLVLNAAYSFGMKHIPILDVFLLMSGYILRLYYGASLTGNVVGGWLYLTVMAGSFYMGLSKRRAELYMGGDQPETRPVLNRYSLHYLDQNAGIFLGLTEVFYALWAMDQEDTRMLFTVPFFILILMRYSLDVEESRDADPINLILHDPLIMCAGVIYTAIIFFIIYS